MPLFNRLDSFTDGLQVQSSREVDDDIPGRIVLRDLDELTIDFNLVNRIVLQVDERREAGPEVIDRNRKPFFTERDKSVEPLNQTNSPIHAK